MKKQNCGIMLPAVCMILLILLFSSCSSTEPEETGGSSGTGIGLETGTGDEEATTEGVTQSAEEILEGVDWSQEYLQCRISNTIAIDAAIPAESAYTGEFGLFYYTLNYFTDEEDMSLISEDAISESKVLTKLVDAWQGTSLEEELDQLLKAGDETALREFLFHCGSYKGKYEWKYVVEEYSDMRYGMEFYPYALEGYDEEAVAEIVEEVANALSDFRLFDEYTYDCEWISPETYAIIEEFYEKYSMNWTAFVNHGSYGFDETTESVFEISILPIIDRGVPLTDCALSAAGAKSFNWSSHVSLVLDSDYEIVLVEGINYVVADGEAFRSVEIMSLKDVLLQFCEAHRSDGTITVVKAELYYTTYEDEDSGEAYLAPFWVLQYVREGDEDTSISAYWAETGDVLIDY